MKLTHSALTITATLLLAACGTQSLDQQSSADNAPTLTPAGSVVASGTTSTTTPAPTTPAPTAPDEIVMHCDPLYPITSVRDVASWSTHAAVVRVTQERVASESEELNDLPELGEVTRILTLRVEGSPWTAPTARLRPGTTLTVAEAGSWIKQDDTLVPSRCEGQVRAQPGKRYLIFLLEEEGRLRPTPTVPFLELDGARVAWSPGVAEGLTRDASANATVDSLIQEIRTARRDPMIVRTEGRDFSERARCLQRDHCSTTTTSTGRP